MKQTAKVKSDLPKCWGWFYFGFITNAASDTLYWHPGFLLPLNQEVQTSA